MLPLTKKAEINASRWFGGEADSVTCMTKTVQQRMEGETFEVVAVVVLKPSLLMGHVRERDRKHRVPFVP